MTHPANRRIDRVLADEFLAGIHERSLADVRSMRAEAEQEETDLSYLRRMLQGRMDILRAELARRSGESNESTLVDMLPSILADEGGMSPPRGLGRHVTSEPSRADSHRRFVETLVADVDLSNPSAHDDAALARVLDRLSREESEVSSRRKAVQQAMDACTAEIARRYREGDADIKDLLPAER